MSGQGRVRDFAVTLSVSAVVAMSVATTGCGLDMTGAQEVPPIDTRGANAPLDGGITDPSLKGLPGAASHGDDDAGATGGVEPDAGASSVDADGGALPSSDGGSPATVPLCAPTVACSAKARVIGAVSGDAASPIVTVSGTTSEWLRVRVNETVLASQDLRAKVTLTSPPGANYDVYAYYDESDNSQARTECIKSKESSASGGSPESLTVAWKDMQPLGGHDDSTNVTIEVRYVSGVCGAGAAWNLAVQGDAH